MRSVHTCILRLMVDPAEREVLRGSIQLMPDGVVQPFSDAPALLALLRGVASRTTECPDRPSPPGKKMGPSPSADAVTNGDTQ